MVCDYEMKVPLHCGVVMSYAQKGTFRKIEILKCSICGNEIEMPRHCGIPMVYIDEDYITISRFTDSEIKEMKKLYSE